MRFGLFFEHQVPRPWHDGDEARVFAEALEQIELADRIGIDCAWLVEHHFLEEYSHSSAPELFLAAASQRTQRIRLGHGIMHTLPAINHPARVAEQVATLDILSGGRVEFGTGEGSAAAELDAFGVDPNDKRAMWEEGVRVALRCLTETPFTGHAGDHVRLAPRNVVPKPIQRPHPPVWVACTRRETIQLAAQHGIGALSFSFFDPEEARRWVDDYYETLATQAVPIGDAVNANLACVTGFFCHEDERVAIGRGAEGTNFIGYSLGHYYVFGRHRPGARRPLGRVPQSPRRDGLRSRGRGPRRRALRHARRQGRAGRHVRPARRHRHTRPGARVPAPLRRLRRRPGDPLLRGRPEPPRAHHGVTRALRPRPCSPSSSNATSAANARSRIASRR